MASSARIIQSNSAWFQKKINLRPQHRGVHLVTEEILRQVPELSQFAMGLCHVQSKFTVPDATLRLIHGAWTLFYAVFCCLFSVQSCTPAPVWLSTRVGIRTSGTTWRWCWTRSYPRGCPTGTPARAPTTWWVCDCDAETAPRCDIRCGTT